MAKRAKKKTKKRKKKPNFEQVNMAFKNPIRTDIIQELSNQPQRPIDLADNIGVKKQVINYHLNELKKGGIVQTSRNEIPMAGEIDGRVMDNRGQKIEGIDNEGNLIVSRGVELTENGNKIAQEFVNRLYEDTEEESEED